ncbi:MAG: autotransporter [Rariglobus sp.]|jgi:autotransporter-associated beta strand protein|nr:autotransporter [Rariglobus sp.]
MIHPAKPARLSSLIAAASLLPAIVSAADYSWNTSTPNSAWSSAGNWTPGGGPPGSSDNVISPTLFGTVGLNTTSITVNNFSVNTSTAWSLVGLSGASSTTNFSIGGTLDKAGSGTLTIRNSGSGLVNFSVNAVNVSAGTLALGTGGALTGFTAGSLTMSGGTTNFLIGSSSGTATVTGAVDLGGTSTVNVRGATAAGTSGMLSVGSLVSSSSTSIVQVNPNSSNPATGTLELKNASGSATFAGVVRNGGTTTNVMNVTKNGAGTQIFTGVNLYSGATTVNDGMLLINNATGSGTGTSVVTVNDGGTFGGTGAATGAITVADGGVLLGGGGAATDDLSLSGNVTFSSGSILELALGASGAHSSLTRTGGVWVFDANQSFNFLDLGATTGLYNNIVSGLTGTETGLTSISSSWVIVNNGWTGTFVYDGAGGIDLTLTSLASIPEPTTYAAILGAGILAVVGFRRRR